MKTKHSFSDRLFSFLALTTALVLSFSPLAIAQEDAPVRYGSGGFAPTDLSGSDDMTGGVVASASPVPAGNSYQAGIEVRLSEMESQMRTLRGQMEEKRP